MEWGAAGGKPQRQRRARAPETRSEAADSSREPPGEAAAAERDQASCHGDAAEQMEDERAALRSGAEAGASYEYLDHTADVQLHAWGDTLEQAFANTALAMFNYMTPLTGVRVDERCTRTLAAEGHDMLSLLFAFLDELLFLFSTELLVFCEVRVTSLDRVAWRLECTGRGERFDRRRHASGTEVKAITYSAMQVTERTAAGDAEIFVIVDI